MVVDIDHVPITPGTLKKKLEEFAYADDVFTPDFANGALILVQYLPKETLQVRVDFEK